MRSPAQGSAASPRSRIGTALLGAMGLLGSAHAALNYVPLAPNAPLPITQVGMTGALPFDVAAQAALPNYTTTTTVPGKPTGVVGDVTSSIALSKYTQPGIWPMAWQNGYTGAILAGGNMTLTMPPRTTAFYVYVSPNNAGARTVTATATSSVAGGDASSGVVDISSGYVLATPDPVPGVGFNTVVEGEYITSVNLVTNNVGGYSGMGLALFGIGQVAEAPTVTSALHNGTAAQVVLTAPAELGTHPLVGYDLLCQTAGGPVGQYMGINSPLTLPASVQVGDSCTLRAQTAAGNGLAASFTVAAAPPVPVPTLGAAALAGLAALGGWLGALGTRRLRRARRVV